MEDSWTLTHIVIITSSYPSAFEMELHRRGLLSVHGFKHYFQHISHIGYFFYFEPENKIKLRGQAAPEEVAGDIVLELLAPQGALVGLDF